MKEFECQIWAAAYGASFIYWYYTRQDEHAEEMACEDANAAVDHLNDLAKRTGPDSIPPEILMALPWPAPEPAPKPGAMP